MSTTCIDMTPVILAQSLFQSLAAYSTLLFWVLLAILVLLTFIWAAFFRRPSSGYPARRHHSKPKERVPVSEAAGAPSGRSPSRHRRRRRARRPLNPTLAQTRGLPPVRDETSTPPPAY
jgi:hypothetical protein